MEKTYQKRKNYLNYLYFPYCFFIFFSVCGSSNYLNTELSSTINQQRLINKKIESVLLTTGDKIQQQAGQAIFETIIRIKDLISKPDLKALLENQDKTEDIYNTIKTNFQKKLSDMKSILAELNKSIAVFSQDTSQKTDEELQEIFKFKNDLHELYESLNLNYHAYSTIQILIENIRLKKEIDRLNDQLELKSKLNIELEKKQETMEQNAKILNKNLETIVEQQNHTRKEMETLIAKLLTTQTELKSINKEKEKLVEKESDIHVLKTSIGAKETHIKNIESDLTKKTKNLSKIQKNITEKERQLELNNETMAQLQKELATNTESIQELNQKLVENRNKLDPLETKLAEKEASLNNVTLELNEKLKQLSQAKTTITSLETEKTTSEKQKTFLKRILLFSGTYNVVTTVSTLVFGYLYFKQRINTKILQSLLKWQVPAFRFTPW